MTPRRIFLLLTILVTLAVSWPSHNFYPQLSQGDHGRDLYAAQEALRGKLPYKDYWWVYGPLMPYYYAVFYKAAGETIVGFLIGKIFLKAVCAAFFYLAASVVMAPSVAFLAAMWFAQSQQEFFFTFNHIGGIAMGLGILWLLFSYIAKPSLRYCLLTLPLILAYALIKINFGLAALAGVVVTIAATDAVCRVPLDRPKKTFYLTALLGIPFLIFLIYWLLLKDLPDYAIRQCMPYFGDDQPHHFSPLVTIPYYFQQHWLTFIHSRFNMGLGVLLHSATLITIVLILLNKLPWQKRRQLLLSLGVLGLFFVINFHEFVVSGVWYRTYWSLPFLFMFHFLMMSTAFQVLPLLVRRTIWTLFGILIAVGFVANIAHTQQQKAPLRFLGGPHGQVFIGNEPEWTSTVNTVSAFLNKELKPGETFFALPYDDIYYYLTGRESPTRQLIFFDHIHIPPIQEAQVIRELQNNNVPYVVMSNRIASSETGLGIFGKTYCPLISQYIAAHYVPLVRQGGDWQAEPGWGHNHGVLIFKRR